MEIRLSRQFKFDDYSHDAVESQIFMGWGLNEIWECGYSKYILKFSILVERLGVAGKATV